MPSRYKKSASQIFIFAVLAGLNVGCSFIAKDNAGIVSGAAASQDLSADAQAELHSILNSDNLLILQWPDFSDQATSTKEFYDQAGHRLQWSRDGKPTDAATQMIAVLRDAQKKGLDPKDYDGDRWDAHLRALSTAGPQQSAAVQFDVALTVSALRYLSDLHLGKVDPKILHRDYEPDQDKYDLAQFLLHRVTTASDVRLALAPVEPPFAGYQRTLAALQTYLQLAKNEKLVPLPQVQKPIDPGKPYDGLQQLADRLRFLGDLPANAAIPADPHLYQGEIVDAVKSFQARHGLEAGGKLGPQTITELNVPVNARVLQLQLTLERWRWVPHKFDQPPIVVNIPEFVLRAYNGVNDPSLKMPVIVGRAMRTETPVFEGDMKYLIFWPYWNVPPSITRNEIVPKITKDPDYIRKNSYEITTPSGQVVTDGTVSEEVLAQLRAGKLMVRQKPGPKNALGLIKFIFPNSNNVYLHSTPSQGLFSQTRRDFSHGCIRVENPAALAEWVLRNNPGWDRQRIDAAFKAQKEQQVNLTQTIPVLIVYGTAVVPEDGRPEFFSDIYGFDAKLAKLFENAYGPKPITAAAK